MGDSKQEVLEKVSALVGSRYGGDYHKAFDHYDKLTTQNGTVDHDATKTLLEDADVDTTKFGFDVAGTYARKIIEALDLNDDGVIDWPEFETKFKRAAGN